MVFRFNIITIGLCDLLVEVELERLVTNESESHCGAAARTRIHRRTAAYWLVNHI